LQAMVLRPDLAPSVLTAFGLSAKDVAVASGKLFDKVWPPDDLSG
jgi:hypothetical protein